MRNSDTMYETSDFFYQKSFHLTPQLIESILIRHVVKVKTSTAKFQKAMEEERENNSMFKQKMDIFVNAYLYG